MNKITARWAENNTLWVHYPGSSIEDEFAFLITKNKGEPVEKPYRLICDGYDETFVKDYAEKPSADEALADILRWQYSG